MFSKIDSEILNYFPNYIKEKFKNVSEKDWESAKEIRIRNGKPIIISQFNKEIIIEHVASSEDILRVVENFSENSLYKVQNEINEGFITIKGGHRIGISGTSVIENEKIKNIKYISSLNIRIAREVIGCSNNLLDSLCDEKKENIDNTIIISPPGCGKTTILRDLIRNLSNGYKNLIPKVIGVVDERNEISATYLGQAQNDLGIRTDVMSSCQKTIGMRLMIRSMGIDLIATDEIGTNEDIDSIGQAIVSGVNLLVTSHGNSIEDIPEVLKKRNVFKNVVLLSKNEKPGFIKNIYKLKGEEYVSIY